MHPIERYRIARGWTQSDLARRVGVTTTTIQAWEKGARLRPRNLAKLAEVLGVDPLQLLNEIEQWRREQAGRRNYSKLS